MKHLLAIDQGTTSSRAVVYDEQCRAVASAQREFTQHFPRPGWVEHDAKEIWESVRATVHEARRAAGDGPLAAIGITNQRESLVVWDRRTGEPVGPAIVWQDRRTAGEMEDLRRRGDEPMIQARTGLLLDAYFSASKLAWMLRETPGLRARAAAGDVVAGTVDAWLIFCLTAGQSHVTDVTNASRTMLFNIHTRRWDPELLALFDIPAAMLPEVRASSGSFGVATALGGAVPICGVAGDQQAALFGQACFRPGQVKCTYGTGCFLLGFTGDRPVASRHRLLTTIAWQLGDGPVQYAVEGSVFVGGAAIQWLRDGLGIIRSAPEVNDLAARVPDSGGVVLVPAFTGLGAPYWDPDARGTLLGLTRGTTAAHLARATLEGIAFQVADVVRAMEKDARRRITEVRVDGGAAASDLLMQIQADLLGVRVERPRNVETTAVGAAMLAGVGAGWWSGPDDLSGIREAGREFRPVREPAARKQALRTWRRAIQRARRWAEDGR